MSTPLASAVSDPATSEASQATRSLWQTVRAWGVSALARDGAVSVIDQAVVSGTSFLTAVIVGRFGSQAGLGVYYLAFTIIVLTRGTQQQIITAPYQVLMHRRSDRDLREYSGSLLIHQLAVTALIVLGLLGVSVAGLGPAKLTPVLWALVGVVPFVLFREFARFFCFAHLHPAGALAIDAAAAVLQIGGLALLATQGMLSIVGVFAIMGGACAVVSAGWLLSGGRKRLQFRKDRVRRDWTTNWRFGRWALLSFVVGSSSPWVIPWLIVAARGEAATGFWAACMTLVGVANVFVQGVGNYSPPCAATAYAQGGLKQLHRTLLRLGAALFVGLSFFLVLLFLFGGHLAVIVFGPEFSGAGLLISLLGMNLAMSALGMVAGNGLWAMNRPSLNFASDVLTLTIAGIGAAALVFPYGEIGAAVGLLAGTMFGALMRVATLARLMASSKEPAMAGS